jgi:hypothetical protein
LVLSKKDRFVDFTFFIDGAAVLLFIEVFPILFELFENKDACVNVIMLENDVLLQCIYPNIYRNCDREGIDQPTIYYFLALYLLIIFLYKSNETLHALYRCVIFASELILWAKRQG